MNNKNKHPDQSSQTVIEAQIDSFIARLQSAGYAPGTICTKRVALRGFTRWRRTQNSPPTEPTEMEVTQFMETSCKLAPSHRCLASTALKGFLEYLRRQGVITTRAPEPAETRSSMLEKEYADFLRNEKGLAELSLRVYLPLVSNLLDYLKTKHDTSSLRQLNAVILRDFLFDRACGRSSEWVRLLATSLRSFLRFLHTRGKIRKDLTPAIPTVRKWAQARVPKKLTPEEVVRVLNAPDRNCATGRRDYAILLLLAKLGLRCSEIILLELRDIRWRSGEIQIRGKGGLVDRLPLPRDIGAAIARYLEMDRGAQATQRVFLRALAPHVPLTGPASIGHIVRHAMVQASVERPMRSAGHLFRHTLASRMLQHGAQLRDISEALRHRSYSTTEIYAKIDMRSLSEVAQPWPAEGGVR